MQPYLKPIHKLISGFFILCTAICVFTPAIAQSENTAEKIPSTPTATAPNKQEVLTLEKLQDCGVLLLHIRQQAINMYREASRVPASPHKGPAIPEIHSIPCQSKKQNLLPARTKWLVYFFANIEPVVRDLGKQVQDIESGSGITVPNTLQKRVCPLCQQWILDTTELNHHLDEMLPLFDDAAHNNLKIQDMAVAIFNDTKKMESVRQALYKVVQDNRSSQNKIMITPALQLNNPELGK